jgi:hypothetical protein
MAALWLRPTSQQWSQRSQRNGRKYARRSPLVHDRALLVKRLCLKKELAATREHPNPIGRPRMLAGCRKPGGRRFLAVCENVRGRFDQQVAPREHLLHTNFPAVEAGLAQIGLLACDRRFPSLGCEWPGGQMPNFVTAIQTGAASQQC